MKKEKQLVTQQETIAWNKWRADIANSIGATTMATLKEKVEVGTKIKYSFDVDKNEQISNIVVSIIKGPINSGTQSAKSTIYKAIKSLNGKVVSSKLLSKDTYSAMQKIILKDVAVNISFFVMLTCLQIWNKSLLLLSIQIMPDLMICRIH